MTPPFMARRRSPSPNRVPVLIGLLAAAAVLLFAGGEAWKWLSSDSGRWFLLKTFRTGDRAEVTRLVGDRIRHGLEQAHVPRDSVREAVTPQGPMRVRWRVALPRDGSPTQVNFAIARELEGRGAEVLSAREQATAAGGERVTLRVGVHGSPTHEVVLERAGRGPVRDEAGAGAHGPEGHIAVVLYGFDDDNPSLARRALARHEVFGMAIPVGRRRSEELLRAAREAGHERVLQVPMEPDNYPRVTPGPGALLVSMTPGRIASLTRRYLDDGEGAVAVSNLMGSFATQDEPLMTALYGELRKTGLTFIETSPGPRSVARPLASTMGVAYDEPDAILDREARAGDDRALDRAWSTALEAAGKRGHQLVWLRATDRSLAWLDRALSAKRLGSVTLVPPSRVMRRPGTI